MSDKNELIRTMNRRGKIIAAVGLIVFVWAALTLNRLWHRDEPTFEGVRLRVWVNELFSPIGTPQHQRGEFALHSLGPAAVPWMLRSIRPTPSRLELWYSRVWSRLSPSLQRFAPRSRWLERAITANSLQYLGLRAVPALIGAYRPDTPAHVRYAIEKGTYTICANANSAAAPVLLPFLSAPQPDACVLAAYALGQIGTNLDAQASAVCTALRANLTHPVLQVRDQAAIALWRIDHDTNAVALLVTELESKPDQQRHLELINFFRGLRDDPGAYALLSNTVSRSRRLQALFAPSPFE